MTVETTSAERRPGSIDLAVGGGLALAALAIYAATLCRSVFWYDSAEYVTAAVVLGIPHPPGYPLYTLLGHAFTWLPMEPAVAVNAMSAVFAALAAGLIYACGRVLGAGRLGAAIGAASLAFGSLYWSQAVIAEVYTPALAFLAAVLLLLLHARRTGRGRLALAAAGLAGLGLGVHLSIATTGLGLALLCLGVGSPEGAAALRDLVKRAGAARRFSLAAGCAVAAAVGSLIFLYLPLRASMDPPLNFGDPSTWDRFRWHITGGNYKDWFDDSVGLWERGTEIAGILYDQLLVVGLGLAAIGLLGLARQRPLEGIALVLAMGGNVYFFFDYQVHDLAVFFLPTTLILCLLGGLGADYLLGLLRASIRPERRATLGRAGAAVLLVYPTSLALGNYGSVDMSEFDEAATYGDQVVETLEADAVILNFTTPAEWKVDAVFGFYYQKVLQARPDVTVLPAPQARDVALLLEEGIPVYLYHPVGRAASILEIAPEGPLYRVVGWRGTPPRTPP